MNIIFFGTPDFVIPVAQALKEHFDLVGIVTTLDVPAGRNHVLTPSPIKIWAEENNIQIFQPQQFNNLTMQQLEKLQPDLFVVAAYGKILPQSVLDIPKLGAINIHPSHLPQFRGPTPIPATILSGITDSAVSIIQMDAEMDHGPILASLPFQINNTDTTQDLLYKVFQLTAEKLPEIIKQFANTTMTPTVQRHDKTTYCQRLTKQDGFLDLDNPPTHQQFDRMVRAYFPWPNVWTTIRFKNKDLRIKFLPKNRMQLEGKNPVDRETFYRGYPELQEKIEKLYNN